VGNGGGLVDAEPKNSRIAAVSIGSSCRSAGWSGLCCWGAEDFEYRLRSAGRYLVRYFQLGGGLRRPVILNVNRCCTGAGG
jgi:hypothetical protein